MPQWCEALPWRRKAEALAWARTQPMRHDVQLRLGVARQVCPLGQVLTQQPTCVLIGAALPGTMRGRKEDANRQAPLRNRQRLSKEPEPPLNWSRETDGVSVEASLCRRMNFSETFYGDW